MPSPAFGADERLVPMRLQRFLARSGVASRRGSENLMTAGRVTVNGVVATELGTKVDPLNDVVAVDGLVVEPSQGSAYLMLNKPAGYITSMSDPHGRPTVAELVPCERFPGLFPVGRLDFDTTGLLLFTTDGDFGQRLLHPSNHVWKTYLALVDGWIEDWELDPLRDGIDLDDGPCQPARCRLLDYDSAERVFGSGARRAGGCVEIKIREGRKNQVKRMLSRIHHPVIALHRTHMGPLELSGVRPGHWRELEPFEVDGLICSAHPVMNTTNEGNHR